MATDINELLDALKNNLGSSEEIIDMDTSIQERTDLVSKFGANPYDALIAELVKNIAVNVKMLNEARIIVEQSGDVDALESFSSVSKANTENLKIISLAITERDKINTQRELKLKDQELKQKEIDQKMEIAKMQIASKEKIAGQKKPDAPSLIQHNNYSLVMTRDKMFDTLFGSDEDKAKVMQELRQEAQDAELVEA